MRHGNPKGSVQGNESVLGSSARHSHVLQQPQPHQRAVPALCMLGRKGEFTSILQNQGETATSLAGKIRPSRATYCLAMLLSALLNRVSQRMGRGCVRVWKFHKLNPENIEKGGGGETSDS